MKKKQLAALALAGLMSVSTAASMTAKTTNAAERKSVVSEENLKLLKARIDRLAKSSAKHADMIIGNAKLKKALEEINTYASAGVTNGNYDMLKELNELFTTELGVFYNEKNDAEENTKTQSIKKFAENTKALRATVDENHLVKRYEIAGKEYLDVARFLRDKKAVIAAVQGKALEKAESELAVAEKLLAAIPAKKVEDPQSLVDGRQAAEERVLRAKAAVLNAKRELLAEELRLTEEINRTELTHRVQKGMTSMAVKISAEIEEMKAKKAFEAAKYAVKVAAFREAFGEDNYGSEMTKLEEKYAKSKADLLVLVNNKIKEDKVTEEELAKYIEAGSTMAVKATSNYDRYTLANQAGTNTMRNRKDNLIDAVIKEHKIDIEAIRWNFDVIDGRKSTYAEAKVDLDNKVADSESKEKMMHIKVAEANKARAIDKEDRSNMKLALSAQQSINLSFAREFRNLNKYNVADELVNALNNKVKADLDVIKKKVEIETAKKNSQTSEEVINGLKLALENLEKTAKEKTEIYDSHVRVLEDLSAQYTDFYNKVMAKHNEVLAGTNYQDYIDITREAADFKEAHNNLAKKLEMPTFDITEKPAVHTNTMGSWVKVDGVWYYKDAQGNDVYKNAWAKIDGVWYRFDEAGKMLANQWFKEDGKWYWLKSSGAMASSEWVYVKGSWFWAHSSGRIAENEWVWVKGQWYYAKSGGYLAMNTSLRIDGTVYKFAKSGAWVK